MTTELAPATVQESLRPLLTEWHEQARKLWELTAEIGALLVAARKDVPEKDWAAWLEAIGLNQYAAFVFMRATRYPELMETHKPGNLEAVARLLPQGAGEAYDAEQAAMARRLREGGMGVEAIRVHMHVSRATVRRWLDPDGHAKREEARRERSLLRKQAVEDERERRKRAALKAKGGPGALAYNHLLMVASALDEAWRGETDRESKRAYADALTSVYKAKDKLFTAEGIR